MPLNIMGPPGPIGGIPGLGGIPIGTGGCPAGGGPSGPADPESRGPSSLSFSGAVFSLSSACCCCTAPLPPSRQLPTSERKKGSCNNCLYTLILESLFDYTAI